MASHKLPPEHRLRLLLAGPFQLFTAFYKFFALKFSLRIFFVSSVFSYPRVVVVYSSSGSTTTNRNTATHPAFLLRTPRRHKPSSESHRIYLGTARTAEQPLIGPAQSSRVHSVVRSCRKSESSVTESRVRLFCVSFFPHSVSFRLCL